MFRKKTRLKMMLQSLFAGALLFEAVGCPQVFANAFRDGTRTFLESGLPSAILAAFDFEALIGGGAPG